MYDQASLLWLANRRFDGEADERVIDCLIYDAVGTQSPISILDNLRFEAETYCGECGCSAEVTVEHYTDYPLGGAVESADVVSKCCGETVYQDPQLICEVKDKDDFPYEHL